MYVDLDELWRVNWSFSDLLQNEISAAEFDPASYESRVSPAGEDLANGNSVVAWNDANHQSRLK